MIQVLLIACLLCQLFLPGFAARTGLSTPTSENLFVPSDSVNFAQISPEAPEVILVVEGVNAVIKRLANISEINVISNCPAHWYCSRNVIRQVAALNLPKGVSIRADAGGAVALVNGKVYALPSGGGGQIKGLKIDNGQVIINGQALQPLSGSDKPGSCTGPDVLEVQVPETYAGDLKIVINGNSQVAVDSWKIGALEANVAGNGVLSTGKLDNLSKTVLDVQGNGKAHVTDLATKALVVNIVGSGTINIDRGSADISNATISGTGKITLHGKYHNLEKAVTGNGVIEILD